MRARGIEKRPIFYADRDREDFLERVARLVDAAALEIYAWALMPNHVHLLLRTANQPLRRSMSALFGGYATSFNLRHERAGHLFQNRYKSTLVEEEPYFLKLVQYIHLNPIPAIVPDVAALGGYRYAGHSVLMGRIARPWQNVAAVLRRFSADTSAATAQYERFVAAGAQQTRPDLSGGGLLRSVGGWRQVKELRRGREKFTSDERILGTSPFVEAVLSDLGRSSVRKPSAQVVIAGVCRAVGITSDALLGNGRTPALSRARGGIAYVWMSLLGCSGREMAATLGITRPVFTGRRAAVAARRPTGRHC